LRLSSVASEFTYAWTAVVDDVRGGTTGAKAAAEATRAVRTAAVNFMVERQSVVMAVEEEGGGTEASKKEWLVVRSYSWRAEGRRYHHTRGSTLMALAVRASFRQTHQVHESHLRATETDNPITVPYIFNRDSKRQH
jgi:hypothetical protein